MMIDAYVTKGTRLRARWLEAYQTCLAGVQLKTGAKDVSVVGTVRHLRSDHPERPVNVTFLVDVEEGSNYEDNLVHCQKCGKDHVELSAKHVVEVLGAVSPSALGVSDGGGSGDGV